MSPLIRILSLLVICLITSVTHAQEKGLESDNRLFHIERSKNSNLVCYDINLSDGIPDTKKPLEVYWVNQEDRPGEVNGLSAVERRFAYGYKVVSRTEDTCTITLTAYPGRELTICKEADGYCCTVMIDGQPAILKKLYVQAKSGNSLSVDYVELTGISKNTGQLVSERVSK